jgi:hypothetical protein
MTWCNPIGGLHPKMAFYIEHFLVIKDGIIVPLSYLSQHSCHALCISLGSFRVGSHWLQIQTYHHMVREDRTCHLCTLDIAETEIHFIFHCPTYYKICRRFYFLFRECSSLATFFSYTDQRCLDLYLRETT